MLHKTSLYENRPPLYDKKKECFFQEITYCSTVPVSLLKDTKISVSTNYSVVLTVLQHFFASSQNLETEKSIRELFKRKMFLSVRLFFPFRWEKFALATHIRLKYLRVLREHGLHQGDSVTNQWQRQVSKKFQSSSLILERCCSRTRRLQSFIFKSFGAIQKFVYFNSYTTTNLWNQWHGGWRRQESLPIFRDDSYLWWHFWKSCSSTSIALLQLARFFSFPAKS